MKRALLRRLVTSLSLVAMAIAICPAAAAQSGDTQPGAPGAPNSLAKKPRRIWTEDDLQALPPVNVVGQPTVAKGDEQKQWQAAPPTAPPTKYKQEFTAKTLGGNVYTEDSAKGKVLLVQFWATWCPHCQNDQAAVDSIYSDIPSDRLLVVAVDNGESEQVVRKYLAGRPRACPIALDKDTDLNTLRTSNSVPLYVVLDRSGNVVASRTGEQGAAGLREMLRRAGL